MNNKKESAVSPVIAVVLILALVVVIATMVSFSVISNVDNILINNVKDVDVTIKISGNNMSVYMVAGKDLALLEDYTLYRLGDKEFDPLVHSINATKYPINASEYPGSINDNISYINILGDFVDGEKVVIFTGKIVDGYVVQTNVVEDDRLFWVKYDDNGGSGDVPEDNHEYKPGSEVTVKFTPVPTNVDGNKFDGWKDSSGTLYTVTGTNKFHIYENTTLYANYTKEYTVKYYDNISLYGGELIETKIYSPGETVTVKDSITRLPDNLFTYTFINWTTNYNGGGVEYSPGSTITIDSDLNLYAQWSYIPKPKRYTVTYNMNGGSGNVVDTNSPYTPYSRVSVLPLDIGKQTQTIGGTTCYFVSWNTNQDGTGNSYYHPDSFIITEPTTLYAVWTTQDPYFRHGTYKSGTTQYGSLDALLDAIEEWKPGTISGWQGPHYGNEYTITLLKDIPLANEPITLRSNWKLTINVDGDIEKTNIGNVYPSTNPTIWAAPVFDEIKSLIVLDYYGNTGSTLTLGNDLVLDGNYRMQESIVMVSPSSKLLVGNNDLTIVNGMRGNRAITTNGGGIFNAGNVTTNGGEIRIDNCWALNGGGFYNSNYYGEDDGIISVADVKLNISNCKADYVEENKPKGAGGGIYSHSNLTLKSGSVIDSCYAAENGGGIYVFDSSANINILEGSKIINNRAESPIDDKGNGGGIYSYYGNITLTKSNISGNTASGYGGGIYIRYEPLYGHGNLSLYYDENFNRIDYSINNNTAREGGGIYICTGASINYNNKNPAVLTELHAYDWFYNIHILNDAVTHKNYNLLDNPITKYYTKGKSYGNTVSELKDSINEWSNLVYGFDLVRSNGDELITISDYPIIISGDPIEIKIDMKITGSETLYLISAPGYTGSLLQINNKNKKLTSSSDVIIDGDGISPRIQSIVVNNNGAELNITGGDFAVKYGYKRESDSDSGGGISNSGTIDVNSGGLLTLSGNIAASYGGGIHNTKTGTIDVNSGGRLTVQDNTAKYGGGIFNEGGTITNSDSNQIILENNEAMFGGGLYSTKAGASDNYYKINVTAKGNNATNMGGGIYNTGGFVEINGNIFGNIATNNGGGIWSYGYNGGSVKINAIVSENTAKNGGGIFTGNPSELSGIVSYNIATGSGDTDGGGGVYNSGTMNVTDKAYVHDNTAIKGGGIYNKVGGTMNVTDMAYVQYNTANNGGGIFNAGTINLNYSTGNSIVDSITGNTATDGGGIYTTNNNVYYNNAVLDTMDDGEVKRWFMNVDLVNTAKTFYDNYYNNKLKRGLTPPSYFKPENINNLVANVNAWAHTYYGNTQDILKDEGGKITVVSDEPIVINNLISISNNIEITGDKTLYIRSSPGYNGKLLDINNELTLSTNVIVDGESVTGRTSALVNINSGAKLNINSGIFTVQNGNRNGNYGGGIYNYGTMNVNSGGSLIVQDNTATYYVGIYNSGTMNVNSGGSLIVQDNTATNGGGGIYNTGTMNVYGKAYVLNNTATTYAGGILTSGDININNGGIMTVNNNKANSGNGGGIYINYKKITVDGTLYVQSNTASGTGGGIYRGGGTVTGNIIYTDNTPNNIN